jgi:hypothetical protein
MKRFPRIFVLLAATALVTAGAHAAHAQDDRPVPARRPAFDGRSRFDPPRDGRYRFTPPRDGRSRFDPPRDGGYRFDASRDGR